MTTNFNYKTLFSYLMDVVFLDRRVWVLKGQRFVSPQAPFSGQTSLSGKLDRKGS